MAPTGKGRGMPRQPDIPPCALRGRRSPLAQRLGSDTSGAGNRPAVLAQRLRVARGAVVDDDVARTGLVGPQPVARLDPQSLLAPRLLAPGKLGLVLNPPFVHLAVGVRGLLALPAQRRRQLGAALLRLLLACCTASAALCAAAESIASARRAAWYCDIPRHASTTTSTPKPATAIFQVDDMAMALLLGTKVESPRSRSVSAKPPQQNLRQGALSRRRMARPADSKLTTDGGAWGGLRGDPRATPRMARSWKCPDAAPPGTFPTTCQGRIV